MTKSQRNTVEAAYRLYLRSYSARKMACDENNFLNRRWYAKIVVPANSVHAVKKNQTMMERMEAYYNGNGLTYYDFDI